MVKISILVFIYFFTVCQCFRASFEFEELIEILLEQSSNADDPNDRVDIDLWNQLNEQDMKNMPDIDDYSDADNARDWLEWYSRVSLRYFQVKSPSKNRAFLIVYDLDWCSTFLAI